jgi:hypothetical protein
VRICLLLTGLPLLLAPIQMKGQAAEPNQIPPIDFPTSPPPQAPVSAPIPLPAPAVDRVSWKLLVPNIVSDQARFWTFPAKLAHGQSWIPTAVVFGTTAGLIALDPTEASYFRSTSTFQAFNNIFTGNATVIGTLVAPVIARGNRYVRVYVLLVGPDVSNALGIL